MARDQDLNLYDDYELDGEYDYQVKQGRLNKIQNMLTPPSVPRQYGLELPTKGNQAAEGEGRQDGRVESEGLGAREEDGEKEKAQVP